MEGRVSSVQSMGAVDGPGLRYVVFLQGCPLRCAYCHNSETWDLTGGTPYTAEDLCKTILRYRPYFGENGGVTVSGGEPLLQPEFVAELFRRLHEHNKFPTEAQYKSHCGGSLQHTVDFIRLTESMHIPLWVRHVVAPGLSDTVESLRAVKALAESFSNLEKIEWLPFKNICAAKYKALHIPFPMGDKPSFSQSHVEALLSKL